MKNTRVYRLLRTKCQCPITINFQTYPFLISAYGFLPEHAENVLRNIGLMHWNLTSLIVFHGIDNSLSSSDIDLQSPERFKLH